jgi:hypothetical protein
VIEMAQELRIDRVEMDTVAREFWMETVVREALGLRIDRAHLLCTECPSAPR